MELPILNGFTYTFKRFEKIGIVGKNGSGKSTFLDIITGRIRPQKGHIQTGETIQIAARKSVKFKAYKALNDAINQ